ncbi:Cif family virulence factor [Bacillus sp. C1]
MQNVSKKIGFVMIAGLLLIGCQSNQEMKKTDVEKKEAKVHIKPEEKKEIHHVIEAFVQTTNEKNFDQHMALFSGKIVGAEDLRTQKEATFQRENKKIELNDVQVKNYKRDYVVVETEEKEIDGGRPVQKKVQYALGKEDEHWKIEEVRTIGKK